MSKSLDFYTNIHIFLLSESTMYDCKGEVLIKSQVILTNSVVMMTLMETGAGNTMGKVKEPWL